MKTMRTASSVAAAVLTGLVLTILALAPIGGAARAGEAPAPASRPALTLEPATPIGPPGMARPDSTPGASGYTLKGADIEGKPLDLDELLLQGPVLLDFWALWCKPCLKELPQLDKIQARWADRGLTVVAINTDSPVELARVRPFVRSARYRFRVITDPSGELKRRFDVNTLPTSLLIAPDGLVLWTNQGYRPGDEKALEAALARFFDRGAGDGK